MSQKTNIEWATFTASPWFGCSKVSPGCAHCYAEELTLRNKWAGWGDNSPRVRSKGFWKDAYTWNRKAEGLPERPRIFTSLMDWLDPKVPIQWLADFLRVIHDCQNLDWLLLTKRPENFVPAFQTLVRLAWVKERAWVDEWLNGDAPDNVWVGVSVENQETADKRIPLLLQIPARVRWLSVEPLLAPINLMNIEPTRYLNLNPLEGVGVDAKNVCQTIPNIRCNKVDWVVVGGESGPKRRDCGVEAITSIVDQCKTAAVPCFVKQDCALKPGQQGRIPDGIWRVKEYPK